MVKQKKELKRHKDLRKEKRGKLINDVKSLFNLIHSIIWEGGGEIKSNGIAPPLVRSKEKIDDY